MATASGSGRCSGPRTRRRLSSGWRSSRTVTCSSTTSWWCARGARRGARSASPASSTWCAPGTRASRFDSDVFLAEQGLLPLQIARAAHVVSDALRARALRAAAARATQVVRVAGARARRGALLRRDGAAAGRGPRRATASRSSSTSSFLDGRRGAHVNISGISGVATKTTYASFLLYSLFHSRRPRRRGGQHEGADLQRQGRGPAVPRPAERRLDDDERATTYAQLGLPGRRRSSPSDLWAPVEARADVADARHRQPAARA